MQTIKLRGRIDEQHRLSAVVPATIPPGPVEIELVLPSADVDPGEEAWMAGIAREWKAELADPREDIYTMADGEPINDPR